MMLDGWLKQHFVLNSARLTAWETLQAEIDNVRRAQAATSSTQQPMCPRTRRLPEGQVARKGQGQRQALGRVPEDVMPDLLEDWPLEARLQLQRGEPQARRQGQGWQGQEVCRRGNDQGPVAKYCPKNEQSLSAVESHAPSSVGDSGATG